MSEQTISFNRQLPVEDAYDLAVSGGGPAGIAAALAAARQGLRVLLIDSVGQLGGMGTNGGAARLLGGRYPDNSRWAVQGIFLEIVEKLVKREQAIHPEDITAQKYNLRGGTGFISSTGYGVPFDPVGMAALLDELMLEAGVDVKFFTQVIDVIMDGDRISHLILSNKSGLRAVPVRTVVDATGDADVAARSGCETTMGREQDHKTSPASMLFHVERVWTDELRREIYKEDSPQLKKLVADLRKKGVWTFPYELSSLVELTEKGTFLINATRLRNVDATDARSVSAAMMRGRLEVQELFKVLKEHVPGFSDARLRSVAGVLGIRESRRIVADMVLTTEQVIRGEDVPDTIGFSAYTWDLPDPESSDYELLDVRKIIRRHVFTPIPYRVMVPNPVTNLICPGRSISVERPVLGILRVQAPCYAMGQAAGTAAVQVVQQDSSFAEVDTAALRKSLKEQGALVDI